MTATPPDQLREALLKLLAVIIGGGLLDLRLDLAAACRDVVLLAGAADDRRVVLGNHDAARLPEHVQRHVLELDTRAPR